MSASSPEPGRRWLPLLLYPILALATYPTIGHLLFGQDALVYALDVFDLPRTGTGADWLANGLALWNLHLTAGNALFAQQWFPPLGIDVPLAWWLGPFGAYVALAWLLPTVAGIGMHLFLRDGLGLDSVAVVAGSIVYLFSYWQFSIGLAAPAVPLLLWLLDRAVAPGVHRWRFVVAGALALALVLYQGLSQVVLMVGIVQLVWMLVMAPGRASVPGRLAVWAGTWALALALYAPSLLTQLVMLPISNRSIWPPATLSVQGLLDGVRNLVDLYSPLVVGVPVGGGIGDSAGRHGTWFLGALALPALVLGLIAGRRQRSRWFVLALLLAVPLWDLAYVGLEPIIDRLPVLRSFQFDRVRHVLPFAITAGAAIGIDVIAGPLRRAERLPRLARWQLAVLGISVIPIAAAAAVAVRQVVRRQGLFDLAAPAVGWALLAIALVGGLVALGAIVLALRRGGSVPLGRLAAILAVGFLAALVAERSVYAWGERLTDERNYQSTWTELLSASSAKRFLASQPGIETDRVLSFGSRANQVAALDMLQADGYQSMYPETYHRLFGTLIAPSLVDDQFHTDYYWWWGNRAITFGPEVDPELVDLVGARWLLVLDGTTPTVPGLVERFSDPSGTVYEAPDSVPRAFVAGTVERTGGGDEELATLAAADTATLAATAFVGPSGWDALGAGVAGTAAVPAGTASIAEYTPDRVVVDVQADRPGVLVLTDVMAPGWIAERDGIEVPVATVDVAFRGVAVDDTTRQVVFRYRPLFTYAGFAIALAALVLVALLGILVRRRDRRHPVPSSVRPDATASTIIGEPRA